ncbi:MAG TPA: hypothetical protein VGI60_16805 [Chthoniobacterales bacterium]|jgi:hypothetical protein
MSIRRSLFLVVSFAILVGCSSLPKTTDDVYVLPCQNRQIEFVIPPRWKPEPQQRLEAVQFAVGAINKRGIPLGIPMLSVSVQTREQPATTDNNDPESADIVEQEKIADEYLKQMRGENFTRAGIIQKGSIMRPDGRTILQWLEVSNTTHLFSFVPEGQCTVEVNMWGEATKEPASLRDFETIVDSIKASDVSNAAAHVIPNHERLLIPQPAFEMIPSIEGEPYAFDARQPHLSVYAVANVHRDQAGNVLIKLLPNDAKKLSEITHERVGQYLSVDMNHDTVELWRVEKPVDDGSILFSYRPDVAYFLEALPKRLHREFD